MRVTCLMGTLFVAALGTCSVFSPSNLGAIDKKAPAERPSPVSAKIQGKLWIEKPDGAGGTNEHTKIKVGDRVLLQFSFADKAAKKVTVNYFDKGPPGVQVVDIFDVEPGVEPIGSKFD